MRNYDLMVILKPAVDEKDEQKIKSFLQSFVGKDVEITEFTIMGKRALSYPIKKYTEGVYVTAKLTGERIMISDFERQVKLGGDIIRYLLTQ